MLRAAILCDGTRPLATGERTRSSIIVTDQRAEAINWARRILQEPNVIFLDTETTGLDGDAEIVDIAIIDRNGRVLLDTLVRPTKMIPSDATSIHGINDPAVADAPAWENVYPLVGRILDQYGPVVVYNAEFDQRILSQVNQRHGLPDFDVEWHCAMRQYAAYVGIWHDKYGTWRWHKLTDALGMVNRPTPLTAHRAATDAESCRQIVEAMAAETTPVFPSHLRALEPGDQRREEPLRPEVIGPGERERGYDQDWTERSGTFPGGQYTVVHTRSTGCSTGALLLILFLGIVVIGLGCCAFFYVAMAFA